MSKRLQVMKFGGTSVGNADCIRRAAEIVAAAAASGSVVAVVSAMSGVTNRLIETAHAAARGDAEAPENLAQHLLEQHREAIKALIADADEQARLVEEIERIINEVKNLCHGTALLKELTPRAFDAISGAGERLSARLVAAALRERGQASVAVEATEVIITNDDYGQAEPLMDETRERAAGRLRPLLDEGVTPVVTGFIGATADGITTTLGRGGSDYSATILGGALDADEIIIWTDVSGVLTADPRLVSDAQPLAEISYNEAADLAFFGAKVLHPKTLRPVADNGIPVWIRNSFAPQDLGTKISANGLAVGGSGVKAITAIGGVSLITVGGRGIVGMPGIAGKTFTAAAEARTNILLISQSSSQNDICFIINSIDAARTVEALRVTFAQDLAQHHVEHITVDAEIAIVAVIGEKMRGTPGIAGRTFSALGREDINIIAIAQGSSEYNVSFVVARAEMRRAVEVVHREFGLERRIAAEEVALARG
ncbi:MAG: aspartate kinase [Pyrinomonadaceae bacterium]